jgi:hypothetical protein
MNSEIAKSVDQMVNSLHSSIVASVDESITATLKSVLDSHTMDSKVDSEIKNLVDETSTLKEQIIVDVLDKLPVALLQMIRPEYHKQSTEMVTEIQNGIEESNRKVIDTLVEELSITVKKLEANRNIDREQTVTLPKEDVQYMTVETAIIVLDKVLSHLDILKSDQSLQLDSVVKQIVTSIVPPDTTVPVAIQDIQNTLEQFSNDTVQQKYALVQQLNSTSQHTTSSVLLELEKTINKIEGLHDVSTKNILSNTKAALNVTQDEIMGCMVESMATSYKMLQRNLLRKMKQC